MEGCKGIKKKVAVLFATYAGDSAQGRKLKFLLKSPFDIVQTSFVIDIFKGYYKEFTICNTGRSFNYPLSFGDQFRPVIRTSFYLINRYMHDLIPWSIPVGNYK